MALSTRCLCVLLLVLVGLAATFSSGHAVLEHEDHGTTAATLLGRRGGHHQAPGSATTTLDLERAVDKREVQMHLNEGLRSFGGSSRGGLRSFGGSSRGGFGSFGGSSRGGFGSFGGSSRGGAGSSGSFGSSRGGARSSSGSGSRGSGSGYTPYNNYGQGSHSSVSAGGRGGVWNMGLMVAASVLAAAWLV